MFRRIEKLWASVEEFGSFLIWGLIILTLILAVLHQG